MAQSGDVLEATVGEGRAVMALGRCAPADLTVQPVVVVIAGELRQCGLGIVQRAEHFSVQDLALERRPEGFDLPVRPGRVDLGADLPDLQLAQRFAKTVEYPRHPVHELGTVVGHEIQRVAAELDAVAQPDQDWGDLLARGDAQAEHVAGVVVDQAIAPGLEVAATLELDKEGTLDGDVPERIDAGALVARTALARARGPARTQVAEELFDPGVADSGDPAPAQLGRDALGVPVRVQAHRDHDLLHPSRVLEQRVPRPAPLGNEPEQTAPRVRALPAPQARSAADAKRERGKDAVLAGDTEHAGPSAYVIELSAKGCALECAATSGRQEPEAGTLLVRVSEPPTP